MHERSSKLEYGDIVGLSAWNFMSNNERQSLFLRSACTIVLEESYKEDPFEKDTLLSLTDSMTRPFNIIGLYFQSRIFLPFDTWLIFRSLLR